MGKLYSNKHFALIYQMLLPIPNTYGKGLVVKVISATTTIV